ncbi:amidohydrolase family protein [Novosphingobium aquimarinum]|uniref:amidohydrolase family protein n=1 Tax=Novosphingobium aquimarinum TaxID=2682494 RepID=UPI0012EB757B|nr:amidohydrolase family protein [Novosphingobium aquimarinum]
MTSAQPELFDAHAHFFSSDCARYPIDVTGAREGEEAIRKRIAADPLDEETLLALWRECGVSGGAAVQYNSVYKTDNRYAIEVGDRNRDMTGTVVMLPAADPGTPDHIARLGRAHNVTGLRLFGQPDADGTYPWLDSGPALETWRAVANAGMAMVVMYVPGTVTARAIASIVTLAKTFPEVPIAIDHCGWAGSGTAQEDRPLEAIVALENISLKFTQININRWRANGYDPSEYLTRLTDLVGPDRVMWGSDVGNTQMLFPALVAEAVAATSRLSERDRHKVLSTNGRAMFLREEA